MPIIRFIHLSDLHLGIEQRLLKEEAINEELWQQIQAQLNDQYKSLNAEKNIILGTGDLIDQISHPKRNTLLKQKQLHNFINGIRHDTMYNSMGNHDVDRNMHTLNGFSQSISSIEKLSMCQALSSSEVCDLYNNTHLGLLSICNQSPNSNIYEQKLADKAICIFTVNNSLFDCPKQNENSNFSSYNNLYIDNIELSEIIQDSIFQKSDLKIALIHHPPSVMDYREIYPIKGFGAYYNLKKMSDYILYGHTHSQDVIAPAVNSPNIKNVELYCGALHYNSKMGYSMAFHLEMLIEDIELTKPNFLLYEYNSSKAPNAPINIELTRPENEDLDILAINYHNTKGIELGTVDYRKEIVCDYIPKTIHLTDTFNKYFLGTFKKLKNGNNNFKEAKSICYLSQDYILPQFPCMLESINILYSISNLSEIEIDRKYQYLKGVETISSLLLFWYIEYYRYNSGREYHFVIIDELSKEWEDETEEKYKSYNQDLKQQYSLRIRKNILSLNRYMTDNGITQIKISLGHERER